MQEHVHNRNVNGLGLLNLSALLYINSKVDPSNTGGIQRAWMKEMKKRFDELKRAIRLAVDVNNVFGIYQEVPFPKAFDFPTSSAKVEAFNRWLQREVDRGLLEVKVLPGVTTGQGAEGAWTNRYVIDAYKKGIIRARYEMAKIGMRVPSVEKSGGITVTMNVPVHINTLGLLYTRVFEDLKGITADMSSKISRVLATGIASGDNPRLLARKLVSVIDGKDAGTLGITDSLGRFIPPERRALILARTEVIRAHHYATVMEYRQWGVEEVGVEVEWRTAGDGRVCPDCESMNGKVFTLDEITNKIPAHPQCRCVALPVFKEKREEKGKLF